MLNAYVGYKKKMSRSKIADKGMIPRFGWGWPDSKNVALYHQGALVDDHFYFIVDYYTRLTHRDQFGYFDRTYEEAIDFGQNPNQQGVAPFRIRNTEGDSIKYVGCYDCFFDE